jgi:hypothetical protein
MAILQIIYLVINLIGTIIGLVWLNRAEDSIISSCFTFISNHFGNIGVAIASILFVALFIPAITAISIVITFLSLISTYFKD